MGPQKNGMGQSFPVSPANMAEHERVMDRIRLRDEFAMAALTGMTTNLDPTSEAYYEIYSAGGCQGSVTSFVAKAAYRLADDMLEARSK